MCGFGGIFGNGASLYDLQGMVDSFAYRGPDAQGFWQDEVFNLGHARLGFIDSYSGSNQPVVLENCNKKYVCAFNGEIYNYRSLREKLAKRGVSLVSEGDAEVMAWVLVIFGVREALSLIDGFFSFVFYDASAGKCFLGRDAFGKKPLFFSLLDGVLRFASEIKGILVSLSSSANPDMDGVAQFLRRGFVSGSQTCFDGIKSVERGCVISFGLRRGNVTDGELIFCEPSKFQFDGAGVDLSSVETLLEDAVAKRLVGDFQPTYLLSGGVDSSLLCSIGSDISQSPITSVFFDTDPRVECDMRSLAETVARKISSNHVIQPSSSFSLSETLDTLVNAYDDPFGDFSAVPSLSLYQSISESSRVVIAGDGADEVFSGYVDSCLFYARSFFPVKNQSANSEFIFRLGKSSSRWRRRLALTLGLPMLKPFEIVQLLSQSGWSSGEPNPQFSVLGPSMLERIAAFEIDLNNKFIAGGDTPFEMYMNFNLDRLADDFLVKVDRASMYSGVEVRCPFLDKKLFSSVKTLGSKAMFQGLESKSILKNILRKRGLAEPTMARKQGFTPPLVKWLTTDDARRNILDRLGDRDSVVNLILGTNNFSAPLSIKSIERNAVRLWYLLVLDAWHRKHFA